MLLFIAGTLGSGKTSVLPGLRKKRPEFDIHDFDERDASLRIEALPRQEQTEYWINRAIENQKRGKDTVIGGDAVYGEILACPSIDEIDHLGVCLLDCDDVERLDRLRRFCPEAATMETLNWATWLRVHAIDPTWCPEMIIENSYAAMRWENWKDWPQGDPRWQQTVIDTTRKSVAQITASVVKWMDGQIARKDVTPTALERPDPDLDAMLSEDGS